MAEQKKPHKTLKIVGWVLGILLLLIVLLPFALCIPWVQNIAKNYACEWASKKTGLDISIGRILIKFPLDLSVDDVLVLDERRDTMLVAGNFTAGVAVKPLLDGKLQVDDATLATAQYRMVTADSSLWLKTRVDECQVRGIDFDWNHNTVNLATAALRGGDVDLDYRPDKVVHELDTTLADTWRIMAGRITLDDVTYHMTMQPTIDDMTAHVTHAELHNGIVDTGAKSVDASCLRIDSADVRYQYPPASWADRYAASHPVPPDTLPHNPLDSIPWTVRADSVRLNDAHVLYALRDAKPASRGIDTDYLELSDVNLALDSVANRGSDVLLTIRHLSGKERSGLQVENGQGRVTLDDRDIDVSDLRLKTLMSDLQLNAHIDQAMLDGKAEGKMSVTTDSRVAVQEIALAYPALSEILKDVPQSSPIAIKGHASGNTRRIEVDHLTASMPRYAHATVSGTIYNPTDSRTMAGNVDFDAQFDNINWVKPTLMDKATAKQVNLPPMSIKGNAKLAGDHIAANATMKLATGQVVGNGTLNTRSMAYDVDATFNNFPVTAILPRSATRNLTAHIHTTGQGTDFLNPNTAINAEVDLAGVNYNNALYKNLKAKVNLNGGNLTANVSSANEDCDVNVDVDGTIDGDHYVLDASGRVNSLDLGALKLMQGVSRGKGNFVAHADVDLKAKTYDVRADVTDLDWQLDDNRLVADKASATLQADAQQTHATFTNEDNHIAFDAEQGIDSLMERFQNTLAIARDQYERRSLNIDTLQQALPHFTAKVSMGTDGLVQRYLSNYDIDFRSVTCEMRNDSNVYLDGSVHALTVGETNVDTLTLHATEWNKYLAFKAHMGNRRGTWDDMAQVTIEGGARGSTLDFLLRQQNIKGEAGYRVGCNATLNDTAVAMRLFPEQPIIGYRQWTLNKDNFVNYNYGSRMLDADLKLNSGESSIALATQREQGAGSEKLKLNIANLKIEEWTALVPSLKDMSGSMNADVDLSFDGKNIDGDGIVDLKQFVYNSVREGDMKLNAHFEVDPATASTRINAHLLMDGSDVALAYGSLNDSTQTSPLNLTLALNRFPLRKASPFIPGDMVRLEGYANGTMSMSGSTDAPLLTGKVAGDSAYVTLPRYGASLRVADDSIAIAENLLKLDNFRLYGLNDAPVNVTGQVDMRNLDDPAIDLTMKGRNVQVMGSEQQPWSEAFGKAFINVDGRVKSAGGNMTTRADVTLLPSSNITYVMKDEVSTLTNQVDENMVTFVDMNDSTANDIVLKTAAATTATTIQANINVQQGAKLNVFLSEDGKDRLTVDGSGSLKYTLDFAGKDNLSGTYTIESGNVRYSPPMISQKNFDIASGSTVQWTGDMLNPQLNLSATEKVKTSVTGSDGGSRLVDFLITARLGGTLSNMELTFDMSSEGDMTVQNELQSMTDVQRSQAAINLLLYNTYSGTNSAGNINNLTASTALFSFLQSQINSWAAKSLKGVDLSFGINQYEGTRSGGTETSYSYRLAKNLFNDRFKIVVGGEYSTDASAEENFSQNLISDISAEYNLNATGTKYVRLFRHTGYESMLEGQVTETGVGFVMKRKVGSLDEVFKKHWRKKLTSPADSTEGNAATQPADTAGQHTTTP